MDTLTEKLGIKLQEWQPDVAVRLRAGGNRDVLDLLPSRTVEQDVLDLIDEP